MLRKYSQQFFFFPPRNLNILSHSLRAYKVSAEKSVDNLMRVPLLYGYFFLMLLLKFSLCLILDIFILICLVKDHFGSKL